ncbi:recombinase family protein [Microbacterium ulmi]|nr:recombinase family protein [Microbacterium ulmi]NII71285.1 DNA invertase Pin-like site-specific DNA recombinase [Microbacterium ulmi]
MESTKNQSTTPIRALIYARASQDRLKLMRSIKDQITDCRAWCEPLGWRVARVITDADRSASQWRRREREGFDEALRLIASGEIDGFVTWEPSRAGRDMSVYVELRAACQEAGVLYLTQGRVFDFTRSDDTFMLGFEFLRAEADANTMRERQLRTVRMIAEKGRPHGRIPYGYRRVYDESTGVLIGQEPDPRTGELVRMMAREVLDGTPVTAIANRMQDLGEETPQGARNGNISAGWTPSTVKLILKNPTIAGKRVFRGQVIGDAGWAPLISAEDFVRLQRLLFDPSRRVHVGDGVTPKSLLSHIAICDYCGRVLRRTLSRAQGDAPRVVRYQCQFRGCYKVALVAADLDQYVTDYALRWLAKPDHIALLAGEDDDWITHSLAARQRLKELEDRLQSATELSSEGQLSFTLLTQIEKTLRPEIEQAQQQLVLPIADRTLRDLIGAEDLTAAWETLELEERRRIIKVLFEIRIMQAPRRGHRGFQPERVLVTPRARGGEARLDDPR